jgi:glycosyltransferase involved in cell wall biosynthesis
LAVALNKGIHLSTAPYIARFDADDLCFPQRLQAQYEFMITHPGYAVVGSDVDYMDRNGNHVFTHHSSAHSYEEILLMHRNKCPFIHSSVLFKKDIINAAGGYNELAMLFEDHLLWSKIIVHHKVCNLPQVLLTVRLNPESITIDEKWQCKRFLEIKSKAIKTGDLNENDGLELKAILKAQEKPSIKEGSYYALLGKKYLWNNYQPKKARANLKKTLQCKPHDVKSYVLIILSFMPNIFIQKIYSWLSILK